MSGHLFGRLARGVLASKIHPGAVRRQLNSTCGRSAPVGKRADLLLIFARHTSHDVVQFKVPAHRIAVEAHAALRMLRRSIHTSGGNQQQRPPPDDPNDPKKDNKDDDDDDSKISSLLAKAFLWMLTAYMFIAVVSLMFPGSNQPEVVRYVSWNEFVHYMLAKGEVEEIIVRPDVDIVTIVLHDGAVVKGKRAENKSYHMNIIDMNKFEAKLRRAEELLGIKPEHGVPVVYERNSDTAGKLLASLIVVALLLSLLSRSRSIRTPISMDGFMQLGRAKFTLVDPVSGQGKGVRFADVAGLQEAKQEVMEFVDYLKRPEYYRNLGAKVPKGALLLGPPGCGKTLLAKAVATESNVPFLSMNGSEFIEMIGGLGAARVRDLFKEAGKRAPCIVYVDEIDAIGRKRSEGSGQFDGASGEGEQTLNQLLVEMDGMKSKEGVLMLASTNRADVLDKALLRPGRFDRHILIDLPTLEERKQIFEQHLKGIVLEKPANVYSQRMAQLTPGFSGADIANVCNEAALHAARVGERAVRGADLEYAVERVVGGTEKRSSAISPQEKRVVATHEAGHALLGWLLPHSDMLLKVSVVPRTNRALGFATYEPSSLQLHTEEQLLDRMCMALGGRAAEAINFNRVTTSAQDDLKKVTRMAYGMVEKYGMNDAVGLLSFPSSQGDSGTGRRPYSKRLASLLDEEVRKTVGREFKRATDVLTANKDKLDKVSEELLQKETLNYKDVEALIGPPIHKNKRAVEPAEFELSILQEAGAHPPPQQPPPAQRKEEDSNQA